MSNVINVTEEGEATLVVEPEPVYQLLVEQTSEISLVVTPDETTPVVTVFEKGGKGDPGTPGEEGEPGAPGLPAPNNFFPASGGELLCWDRWLRPDGLIVGTLSESGHVWTSTGADPTHNVLVDNGYVPLSQPNTADVIFLDPTGDVVGIATKFSFIGDGTTQGQNAVMGACRDSFGEGSIQMASYGPTGKTGSSPHRDWIVFVVEIDVSGNIVEPYPEIAGASWLPGFSIDDDGETEYWQIMIRTDVDKLTVIAPDGSTVHVQDSRIPTYWGNRVGVQCRRALSTDGHVKFTGMQASGIADQFGGYEQPAPGFVLSLPGTLTDYAQTQDPGPITGDLELIGLVQLPSWTPSTANTLFAQENGNGHRCWRLDIDTVGHLRLTVSLDGTAYTQVNSTALIPGTAGRFLWLRATRTSSDGVIRFYSSSDPVTKDKNTVTWTQFGPDKSSPAGVLFDSDAPITLGQFHNSGALQGAVAMMEVRNGIGGTALAGVDFRSKFTGLGVAGRQWTMRGRAWTWLPLSDYSYSSAVSVSTVKVPDLPSYVQFYGDSATSITTPKPVGANYAGDLDFKFAMPPEPYPTTGQYSFGGIYGSAGQQHTRVQLTAVPRMQLVFSFDGTATTTITSTVNVPTGIKGARVTRNATTGDITFYTTTSDPYATDIGSIAWTQLGAVQPSTPGGLFNSSLGLSVGNTAAAGFGGKIYQASFSFGGSVLATVDARRLWGGQTYTGPSGNLWTLNGTFGTTYRWFLVEQAIDQLVTDLANLAKQPGDQVWRQSGAATVTTSPTGGRWFNDTGRTVTINGVRIQADVAPSANQVRANVLVSADGVSAPTSIFASTALRPTLSSGVVTQRVTAFTSTPMTIPAGGYMTVEISEVAAGATGVQVQVEVS